MLNSSRYQVDQAPSGERRRLLIRTPRKADVLDIGCWGGFAGRYLGPERDAIVDGVEPDGAMASHARAYYREVIASTIEAALDDLSARARRYDTLLLLDVLEHLVDPGSVLSRLRTLVSPGGSALVSIPNVAHWSIRKELALGRWCYEDSGLLDRTHLRFFTQAGARDLLEQSGWRVTWESSSPGQLPLVRLSERRLRVLRRWPTLFGVQLLFEARPHG